MSKILRDFITSKKHHTYRKEVSEIKNMTEDFFLSFNKDSDLYPSVQQGDNGQSMVLGGMDKDGNNAFNLLSSLCLKAKTYSLPRGFRVV